MLTLDRLLVMARYNEYIAKGAHLRGAPGPMREALDYGPVSQTDLGRKATSPVPLIVPPLQARRGRGGEGARGAAGVLKILKTAKARRLCPAGRSWCS